MIRKAISDEQILGACDMLRRHGIPNLKCYFMIGQPTETISALAYRAADRITALTRRGEI